MFFIVLQQTSSINALFCTVFLYASSALGSSEGLRMTYSVLALFCNLTKLPLHVNKDICSPLHQARTTDVPVSEKNHVRNKEEMSLCPEKC